MCEASQGCLRALATLNNLLLPHFSSIQPSCFNLLLLFSAARHSLSILYLFCTFAPTFGCLTVVCSTDLQAARLLAWDLCDMEPLKNLITGKGIHSFDVLCMPTQRYTWNPEMYLLFIPPSFFPSFPLSSFPRYMLTCRHAECVRHLWFTCVCVSVSVCFCLWLASASSVNCH